MLKYFKEASPESCGISSEYIIDFVNSLNEMPENQETHGFMLIRHGKVISKGWFDPYTPETTHTMFSCSKAFTGMAIAFAQEEGLLSIDDYVADFFPELIPDDVNERILKIQIKHLLTMTTGQKGEAIHSGNGNSYDSDDWAYIFFRRETDIDCGTEFRYDSFASYMISAIIQKVTGLNLVEYLTPRLFQPLDIPVPYHIKDKFGICIGYSGFRLTLEDFAKVGQLFLNSGKWEGKQLLPKGYCEEANKKQIDNNESTGADWQQGYCYQFWRGRYNTYRFCGAFGQMCVVMPELDAVLAIQNGYDNDLLYTVLDRFYDKLMLKFSEKALPENTEKLKELNNLTENLKLTEMFSSPSAMTEYFNDKEIPLTNKFGYKSISLKFYDDKVSITLKGNDSVLFDAGLTKTVISKPENTDFTCLEKGDNAPFYSFAYWKRTNEFEVTSRIIGTPCIVKIKIFTENGELKAELKAIRGK